MQLGTPQEVVELPALWHPTAWAGVGGERVAFQDDQFVEAVA